MTYSQHDHYHCWSEDNPPCGQKIKHFECCLCKKEHTEIETERQKQEELVEAEREFWEQIVANQKVEIEMLRVKPDKQIFITQPNNHLAEAAEDWNEQAQDLSETHEVELTTPTY
jgi:hypothetical protein